MKNLEDYVLTLESLAQRGPPFALQKDGRARIDTVLDGQPAQELRRVIGIEQIRQAGAFFTSSKLANIAVKDLTATAPENALFYDPACGVGDLLTACARRLRLSRNYAMTVQNWGECIAGTDLHPEFVRAAKARLAISAVQRGVKGRGLTASEISRSFPLLTRAHRGRHPAYASALSDRYRGQLRHGSDATDPCLRKVAVTSRLRVGTRISIYCGSFCRSLCNTLTCRYANSGDSARSTSYGNALWQVATTASE